MNTLTHRKRYRQPYYGHPTAEYLDLRLAVESIGQTSGYKSCCSILQGECLLQFERGLLDGVHYRFIYLLASTFLESLAVYSTDTWLSDDEYNALQLAVLKFAASEGYMD